MVYDKFALLNNLVSVGYLYYIDADLLMKVYVLTRIGKYCSVLVYFIVTELEATYQYIVFFHVIQIKTATHDAADLDDIEDENCDA
jgi:hypothetical protein